MVSLDEVARIASELPEVTEGLAAFVYRVTGAEVCRTVRLRPSGVLLVTDVVGATSGRAQLLTQRFRPGEGVDVTWTDDGCRLNDGNRAAAVTFSAGPARQAGDQIVVDCGRPRTRWTATMKVAPA